MRLLGVHADVDRHRFALPVHLQPHAGAGGRRAPLNKGALQVLMRQTPLLLHPSRLLMSPLFGLCCTSLRPVPLQALAERPGSALPYPYRQQLGYGAGQPYTLPYTRTGSAYRPRKHSGRPATWNRTRKLSPAAGHASSAASTAPRWPAHAPPASTTCAQVVTCLPYSIRVRSAPARARAAGQHHLHAGRHLLAVVRVAAGSSRVAVLPALPASATCAWPAGA